MGPASPRPSFSTKTKERNGEVGARTALPPLPASAGNAPNSRELHHGQEAFTTLAHISHRHSHPGSGCSSPENQGHTQRLRLQPRNGHSGARRIQGEFLGTACAPLSTISPGPALLQNSQTLPWGAGAAASAFDRQHRPLWAGQERWILQHSPWPAHTPSKLHEDLSYIAPLTKPLGR